MANPTDLGLMLRADGRAVHASSSSPVVETQRELARARQAVIASAHDIRDDVKELTDWRRPIRARPLLFIGSAFAVGLLLAALSQSSTFGGRR